MPMNQKQRKRYTAEFKTHAVDLRALRREVARLRQENDILKKAAVILGTKPQPNSAP